MFTRCNLPVGRRKTIKRISDLLNYFFFSRRAYGNLLWHGYTRIQNPKHLFPAENEQASVNPKPQTACNVRVYSRRRLRK